MSIKLIAKTATAKDLESQTGRNGGEVLYVDDPYKLSLAIKNIDEIISSPTYQIKSKSRCCEPLLQLFRIDFEQRQKNDKIKHFYEKQNKSIERLLKPVTTYSKEAKSEEIDQKLKVQIAIYASFAASIILAVLQVYAAISSGSLSLFTVMADAIFDPLSNLILIISSRFINSIDSIQFPSGKSRVETIGNISFCFIMTTVSMILIVFSIRGLAFDKPKIAVNDLHLPSLIVVASGFSIKLLLFLYCWGLKDRYTSVKLLWQDHRNDLLLNGFGILMSVLGSKIKWWIDPAGAIIISLIIIYIWLRTLVNEYLLIIGITAPPHIQQVITYISMLYSPKIDKIDKVRAYYSGPKIIIEVDIVMQPDFPLRITHDVAEELRSKLEELPDVGRVYINVNYDMIPGLEYKS